MKRVKRIVLHGGPLDGKTQIDIGQSSIVHGSGRAYYRYREGELAVTDGMGRRVFELESATAKADAQQCRGRDENESGAV